MKKKPYSTEGKEGMFIFKWRQRRHFDLNEGKEGILIINEGKHLNEGKEGILI